MTPATRVWRVFYTKPRAEKRVETRLLAAGLDVFLPMRTTIRQWSDRKQRVSVPLFPAYLFARVDERERLAVLEDEGVVKTVHFGGALAAVPEREMALIRTLAESPEYVETVTREAFPVGAEVYVSRGPLAGVHGRVIGHPRELYLIVEVPSVQQAVRIQMPAAWAVRPASRAPVAPGHTEKQDGRRAFIRPEMR